MWSPAPREYASAGPPDGYAVRSETNQRENNEDCYEVYDLESAGAQRPVKVLAVADGMGGHAHGEHASRETLSTFGRTLSEQLRAQADACNMDDRHQFDGQLLSGALRNSVHEASAHVRRIAAANRWGRIGSTIVVVVILGDTAIAINLGDSPLFHYRTVGGELTKVTDDHTVAGALERAGMITPEMARYHEGRGRLEFFVGADTMPREDPIYRVDLADGDLLLLCSDGVSGSLLREHIAEILSVRGNSLEDMATRLLQAALDAGETDNQTLILWRHESAAGPHASTGSAGRTTDASDEASPHAVPDPIGNRR